MDSRLVGSWRGRIIDDRFNKGILGRMGEMEIVRL